MRQCHLKIGIIMVIDSDAAKPNLVETDHMLGRIAEDKRFSPILDSLVRRERDGVVSHFTPAGAALFETPEQQNRLGEYVSYARSFNEYLDDLMGGNRKPDDQYPFREGEANGTRTKLGKSGAEGQVFNFPPYVVKETRSDYLEQVSSDKYIPHTQIKSLVVMEGLRPVVKKQTDGVVSVPEHYGVVSFDIENSKRLFNKPRVELMVMEKVGDDKGTTAEDVEKGKAYQEIKTELLEKAKQALAILKFSTYLFPYGVLRDLGAHNLLVNPEALKDNTQPLFYLIDQ